MGYYDETAAGYNELHGAEQTRKAKAILAYLVEHKLINEHTRLLDVGAGTTIATALFPGDKTALEPSRELLKQAKDMSIKLVHGVGEDLPFADKWFDVTICLTAIHNFTDFKKGIAEIKRVTYKTAVITVLKKSPKAKEIEKEIKKAFKVVATLDDVTDTILILSV
ncbi:MAG: methyltransferase domain-containing protein [Nanoarchaeota archaeon]